MKMLLCATALATVLATPASAWVDYGYQPYAPRPTPPASPQHPRIIHDSWRMTCYPTGGESFDVVVTASTNTLLILSHNGTVRQNQVNKLYDDGAGFTVEATGLDYKNELRHLRVHFDPEVGYLWVLDHDIKPSIYCGPDVANSDD